LTILKSYILVFVRKMDFSRKTRFFAFFSEKYLKNSFEKFF